MLYFCAAGMLFIFRHGKKFRGKKNPLGEQRIDAKAEAAAGACIEAV
jgi:hypothetical protein